MTVESHTIEQLESDREFPFRAPGREYQEEHRLPDQPPFARGGLCQSTMRIIHRPS